MKSNPLKPELYVTNFQKSLHFYKTILGFTVQDPDGYLLRFSQDIGERQV